MIGLNPTHDGPGTLANSPMLSIDNLRIRFQADSGAVDAVNGLTLEVSEGESLAVVGESGSGKTLTALTPLDLLPGSAMKLSGDVRWRGQLMNARGMRELRGRSVSMIFQDPIASLNPLVKVGRQLEEVLRRHLGMAHSSARRRAVELLKEVGIPEPRHRMSQFPHELSGGMAQRVMIAMAIATEPDLLIADEPTSALDVTIQAQLLDLLVRLQQDLGMALLLITHDLGIVSDAAQRVAVMYSGTIVEDGSVEDVFLRPQHPYTKALLQASPDPTKRAARMNAISGSPPSGPLLDGCPYRPRCERSETKCGSERPELMRLGTPPPGIGDRHVVACWYPIESTEKTSA